MKNEITFLVCFFLFVVVGYYQHVSNRYVFEDFKPYLQLKILNKFNTNLWCNQFEAGKRCLHMLNVLYFNISVI